MNNIFILFLLSFLFFFESANANEGQYLKDPSISMTTYNKFGHVLITVGHDNYKILDLNIKKTKLDKIYKRETPHISILNKKNRYKLPYCHILSLDECRWRFNPISYINPYGELNDISKKLVQGNLKIGIHPERIKTKSLVGHLIEGSLNLKVIDTNQKEKHTVLNKVIIKYHGNMVTNNISQQGVNFFLNPGSASSLDSQGYKIKNIEKERSFVTKIMIFGNDISASNNITSDNILANENNISVNLNGKQGHFKEDRLGYIWIPKKYLDTPVNMIVYYYDSTEDLNIRLNHEIPQYTDTIYW